MHRKTIPILFSCMVAFSFYFPCVAQNNPKAFNGKLLSKDGEPAAGYKLHVKPSMDSATTGDDGSFGINGNAGDSVIVSYGGDRLTAFKLPQFKVFSAQMAEKNSMVIKELAVLNKADTTTRPVANDSATKKDTNAITQQKPDSTGPPIRDSANTAKKDTTHKDSSSNTISQKKDTSSIQNKDTGIGKQQKNDTTTISGIVTDANQKPISGASINLNGREVTTTKSDGSFTAPYFSGATVSISSTGYSSKDVPITNPQEKVQVVLSSKKPEELERVTVTALGLSKKGKSVGYSVQEIKGDAVQTAKETNFVNALQGKLSGVQINTNTGSMSGASKVVIRGNKSITGNNNALFVVDGIFMSNSTLPIISTGNQQIGGGGYDYGSPIQDLNPDDIDQVSVLKGAAAAALYGSRGSNGVVLITTKKSNRGKLGISYSLNAQMDKVYILPHYQNSYGGGSVSTTAPVSVGVFDTLWQNQNPSYFSKAPTYSDPVKGGYDLMPQFAVDESWGPALKGQVIRPYYSFDKNKNNPYFGMTTTWSPQPNNVRDFYRTGTTITNSVSVGGHSDKGSFRLSYSNVSQKFILPNSNMNRNNIGFNGTYKVTEKITAVASANYSDNRATGRPGTGFSGTNPTEVFSMYSQRQLEIDKLKYYEFPDGSQVSWNRKAFNDPTPASATSPYWTANKAYETDERSRLYGLAGFDIKPVEWINISAKVFLDKYHTLIEERVPKDYQAGSYTRTTLDHQEVNYQLLANARRNLSKKIDLNITAGGNIMQLTDESNSAMANGLISAGLYTLSNSASRIVPIQGLYKKQINSLFADATFGYNNTIFLDITGRNDWASTLPQGHNSYFYPSASLSAIFSDWLKWKWLSFGKLRASIAQIGSDTDPYRTYQAYAVPTLFGSLPMASKDAALANPNLKPEISRELEAGVELKFLNNRVGIDATFYTRDTRDLIVPLAVSPASGYTTFYANVGKSRSKGVELTLTGTPIQVKNFAWDIAVNFSANRSKLLAMDIPNNPTLNTYILGTERRRNSVSVAAIVGQPLYVLTGTDYTYMNGQKVIDSSGHYVPSKTKIIGNTQPDYIGGITNTFTYKDFSLSALIDFQHGGNFFSYTNMYGLSSGLLNETAANNVRENGVDVSGVSTSGQAFTKHISAADYYKNDFGINVNKANVYDASYIYLREVKLGYKLPQKVAKLIKASSATFSLYGRNLWLMHSNAPNVDPSNILNSDSNIIGLEGGALPSLRSFGLNLNVIF